MPIETTGTKIINNGIWSVSVQHENGSVISATITAGYLPSTSDPDEGLGDEAAQDLINYLAAWNKADVSVNPVSGVKRLDFFYAIAPDDEPS